MPTRIIPFRVLRSFLHHEEEHSHLDRQPPLLKDNIQSSYHTAQAYFNIMLPSFSIEKHAQNDICSLGSSGRFSRHVLSVHARIKETVIFTTLVLANLLN